MIKMLIIGYIYGVKSERRLEEEISLNIAYRWFCGISLSDRVPDHSTFSKNRERRFKTDDLYKDIFNEIVMKCIDMGIVTGEEVVADGTFVPGNISKDSKEDMQILVEHSTVKYLEELDKELSEHPGYKPPETTFKEKTIVKSTTDPECGYIHQERKKGLGYLAEVTTDTMYGIVTGVDCYPANFRESDIILKHLKDQTEALGLSFCKIALDAGYDVGAIHRGLEMLGIIGYCSRRMYHNNAMKKGFEYEESKDSFKCEKGKYLEFKSITYKKSQQNYFRLYGINRSYCAECDNLSHCSVDKGRIRINASAFYPSFYRNMKRCETPEYHRMKKIRSIWAEGTFAVLKREHNLGRINKRGLRNANEECLLAVIALNLKRMAQATLLVILSEIISRRQSIKF